MEYLDEYLYQLKRLHAKENGVEVGQRRCECGKVYDWDEVPTCTCEEDQKKREQAEKRGKSLRKAYASITPGMSWCRVDDPQWRRAVKHPELINLVQSWKRSRGSQLICGPTGAGKTISSIALAHRILDTAKASDIDSEAQAFAMRLRWMSMRDLNSARANSGLGKEAELVVEAMQASLLVLDEVGFEDQSLSRGNVLFEVLDRRYLDRKPTIVTSGLTPNQFSERYGAAALRRLVEPCGGTLSLFDAPATGIATGEAGTPNAPPQPAQERVLDAQTNQGSSWAAKTILGGTPANEQGGVRKAP